MKIAGVIENFPSELPQSDTTVVKAVPLVLPYMLVLYDQVRFLLKCHPHLFSSSLECVLRLLGVSDDPFHAEKEMWDWPKINLSILGMNSISGCSA